MDVYSVDTSNNLGNWIMQKNKLLEFIHNLIKGDLKYDQVLDRTEIWNGEQTISFLPFYVHERVNLAWRRSIKKSSKQSEVKR